MNVVETFRKLNDSDIPIDVTDKDRGTSESEPLY